jgi:phospholipase D1/2
LRSISTWSGGNRREYSIYKAYLSLIERAEHFIYIENQFFISNSGTGLLQNKIAESIFQQIQSKIEKNKPFRVIVVLPYHPDSNYVSSAAARFVMKWQYDV